jgi:prophage maintenance system killer protein
MHPISEILCSVYKDLAAREGIRFPLQSIHQDRLDTIVHVVEGKFWDHEHFPTRKKRAAAYLCHLIKGHPVTEGNKRLAVLWLQIYCDAFELKADPLWSLDRLAVAIEAEDSVDDDPDRFRRGSIFSGTAMRARFEGKGYRIG